MCMQATTVDLDAVFLVVLANAVHTSDIVAAHMQFVDSFTTATCAWSRRRPKLH